jgi:hypothetical protein
VDKFNLGDLVEISVEIGLIVAWDQWTKDWVKIRVGYDEFHMRHVGQIRKIQ